MGLCNDKIKVVTKVTLEKFESIRRPIQPFISIVSLFLSKMYFKKTKALTINKSVKSW